jgi:hypothetical protein
VGRAPHVRSMPYSRGKRRPDRHRSRFRYESRNRTLPRGQPHDNSGRTLLHNVGVTPTENLASKSRRQMCWPHRRYWGWIRESTWTRPYLIQQCRPLEGPRRSLIRGHLKSQTRSASISQAVSRGWSTFWLTPFQCPLIDLIVADLSFGPAVLDLLPGASLGRRRIGRFVDTLRQRNGKATSLHGGSSVAGDVPPF